MNKLTKILSFGLLGSAGVASAAIGDYPVNNYGTCPMGGMMGGYYGGGFQVLSWVTYLLMISVAIAAIYWLVKSANRKK